MNKEKNTLSVCIICKNEEEYLPSLLEKVQLFANEIIFVDTGSTDTSVEVAKQYGAKVFIWEWSNDFSAARNKALQHATGEWVLFLDCDDELSEDTIRNIRGFIQSSSAEGCYVRYENVVDVEGQQETIIDHKLTLFRNRSTYRFREPIHETIEESMSETVDLLQIPVSNITIKHQGYKNPHVLEEKQKRNLQIIEETIRKEGKRPFLLYCQAVCYLNLFEYEQALKLLLILKDSWSPSHPLHSDVCYKIALCLFETRQLDLAQMELMRAIEYYPDFTDLNYFSACIDFHDKKYEEAMHKWKHCIQLGDAPPQYTHLEGTGTFLAWQGIAQVYTARKEYVHAIEAYRKSLELNPGHLHCIRQFMIVLADHFSFQESYLHLSSLYEFSDPQTVFFLALIAEQVQRWEFAYALLSTIKGPELEQEIFTKQMRILMKLL
ncbi:hypothetical protein DNHGIG_20220 [Collibacillus ludicampi]|uniref:Glycosyltransferase 2-like domain-containing protein n=1 Tax=Collibacillus ludicampi TaxID=2771369 RepID=A0AAV4LFH4_9BACL|nr:glycosyltransferase [Collibacillus ludicampi]GIM46473.1 hypothetical protein DNHGIG_20220 [Collibacillus ludicampi]